ncbi:MAG TPA: NAD(P)H-quinone oxidoreductase [Bryobacteraceae bacterium]
MRQIEVVQPGGTLKIAEAPIPTPGPGEVLIKVEAAGVNRADLLQAAGRYKLPPGVSPILGMEAAGTVEALGTGAHRWSVGDRVSALLTAGGYAEYAVTPAVQCLPFPEGLNAVQSASLPETFFTVWLDVFDIGGLKPGETLLVHGGSSGIGITAIQIAKALGSRVIATAGSEEKCAACRELGADVAINYRTADFEKEAGSVNVILDMVGGSYTIKNLRILAPGGRLVNINFMESSKAEIDLSLIVHRQLTVTGSGLRPQTVERKAAIARDLEERVWPLISSGKIRPVIDSVYLIEKAAEAHRRLESSQHIGKIILQVS